MKVKISIYKDGGLIYAEPPKSEPKRMEMIKYATWRMRLYQQLESISPQQLQKKPRQSIDLLFPKLCFTQQQRQFYTDFLSDMRQTHDQELISHFICRMLYSRDLKNHDTFIRIQRQILSLKLDFIKKNHVRTNTFITVLKSLIEGLAPITQQQMNVTDSQYRQFQSKITRWFQKGNNKETPNQTFYIKVPFQYGQVALRKRRCFLHKGFAYADVQTSKDVVLNLYVSYLKQQLIKTRSQTQKLLQNDIENQLKPFMDKAINSINVSTIAESQLNSEFKLNIKNIQAVSKKYFPPCMHHLNKKLRQNNHLKHQGRRQLWLFFKGCGMDVNDNKQYFNKYFSIKLGNSELKSHMYNIQHAYGLVGKKQQERPKMCRAIITGTQPKKDEHHGCPFKHWNQTILTDFLRSNYTLKQDQLNQIIANKKQNYFQIACGRLFQANFKPQKEDLPQQITGQLGKSPHQYFIAGMAATQWINTKTLRPTKVKPAQNMKMQLQF